MPNYIEFSKFESISDFKWSLECGGEIVFERKGKSFGAFKYVKKTPKSPEQIIIAPSEDTEKAYPNKYPECYVDTADEVLDYVIDGDRLRDVITQVEVFWRTL